MLYSGHLRKLLRNRVIHERKVVCVNNDSGVAVCGSRCGDAGVFNIVHGERAVGNKIFAELCHVGDDLIGLALCLGRHRAFLYNLTVFIDDTYSNIGTAEVDSEIIHNFPLIKLVSECYLLFIISHYYAGVNRLLPIASKKRGIFRN